MNISDLNYLEVLNSETANGVAGSGPINVFVTKNVNLQKFVFKNITKHVNIDVVNNDVIAEAEGDAECFGPNCGGQVDVFTWANDAGEGRYEAFAYGEALSAIDLDP